MQDQIFDQAIEQIYRGAEKLKRLFDDTYDGKENAASCALHTATSVWMDIRNDVSLPDARAGVLESLKRLGVDRCDKKEAKDREVPATEVPLTE